MSASALWVYFPFLCGLFLLLFVEKQRFVTLFALILCAILTVIAMIIPVNSLIVMGSNSIIFSSDSDLFGRSMSINRSEQTAVAFFYSFAVLWFAGTLFVNVYRFFIPAALMVIALLVGVMAVDPFIYGAFFVIIAILIFLPLLWNEHQGDGQAIFRFLFYQILGLIFLSLGGWLSTSVDLNPQDEFLLKRAVILLFFGFSFWLAVFPFHSWIAMLMEKTNPYISGFIISLLQFSSLFLLLNFLNTYLWMRTYGPLFEGLKLTGLLLLLVGSLWSMFQKNLQRMLAFTVVAENGISVLLLGMGTKTTVNIFLSYLFIHVLALLIWSMATKDLGESTSLSFADLNGLFFRKPYISLAILMAFFSVAGMPLLAGFPMRVSLLSICFADSDTLGWLASIGCWLLLFSGFRLLLVFLRPGTIAEEKESTGQRIALVVGMLILLFIGVFPGFFNVFIVGIQQQYAIIFGG